MAKRIKPQTVLEISKAAGLTVDDALLLFWTNDLWDPDKPSYVLQNQELIKAKAILGSPTSKQETRISYWLNELSMSREELQVALESLGISLERNAWKLPKNALSKLRKKYPKQKEEPEELDFKSADSDSPVLIEPPTWPRKLDEAIEVKHLTVDQVLEIFSQLSKDYEGTDDPVSTAGMIDLNMVSSAVENPKVAHEKYHNVHLAVATTVFSLIRNHPFPNGNKRTALISMLVMLDENGLVLFNEVTESELFTFVYDIAASKLLEHPRERYANLWEHEILEIARWIKANCSNPVEPKIRPLPWRVLRQKFEELGCQVSSSNSKGGSYTISRTLQKRTILGRTQTLRGSLKVAQDGTDIDKGVIVTLRKALQLDDLNGVSNSVFYSRYPTLPSDFIQTYSGLIRRLAKF